MDRWGVYELLKGNDRIKIKDIEEADSLEVKEGLIEFLMVKGLEKSKSNELVKHIKDLTELIEHHIISPESYGVYKKAKKILKEMGE